MVASLGCRLRYVLRSCVCRLLQGDLEEYKVKELKNGRLAMVRYRAYLGSMRLLPYILRAADVFKYCHASYTCSCMAVGWRSQSFGLYCPPSI